MQNKVVKHISLCGVITGLIAAMTFIPNVGYIFYGPLSLCTIHIVVLTCCLCFGWIEGLASGLAFGLLSLLNALTRPAIDYMFINPMVSVLPRFLFAIVSVLVFIAVKKIKRIKLRSAMIVVSSVLLTLVHTALTCGLLWVFNFRSLSATYANVFMIIFSINLPIEMAIAGVLVPLLALAVSHGFKEYNVYRFEGVTIMKETFYDKLTKPYQKDLIDNLKKYVAINSVYDETTKNKDNPFGEGVSNALDFIDKLAKEDGFQSTNYKNMVVEILAGSGKKNITIMAHADVVPAGTGWSNNPFTMVEKDGVLYGRGVADDKGPLLSSYYALKALRDNDLLGDYTVRFLVGGNEESGSLGIEYYFHTLKKEQPDLGFSPDSDFPLIFAEKGIGNFEISSDFESQDILSIKGGVAFNSVIEKCEVLIKKNDGFIDLLTNNGVDFTKEDKDNNTLITFLGTAAHGSIPWAGKNAGMIAIHYLGEYFDNPILKKIDECYSDPKCSGVKANCYSEDMYDNSFNIGLIKYENRHISLVCNFRYVNTCNLEQAKKNIVNNSNPLDIKFFSFSDILYYPKDSILIKTLLSSYQEETGDYKTAPISTGGGTYAKEANNVVAFGMQFPGWESNMHSPGECSKKEHLFKSMSIYARAIVELGKKLNEN